METNDGRHISPSLVARAVGRGMTVILKGNELIANSNGLNIKGRANELMFDEFLDMLKDIPQELYEDIRNYVTAWDRGYDYATSAERNRQQDRDRYMKEG